MDPHSGMQNELRLTSRCQEVWLVTKPMMIAETAVEKIIPDIMKSNQEGNLKGPTHRFLKTAGFLGMIFSQP